MVAETCACCERRESGRGDERELRARRASGGPRDEVDLTVDPSVEQGREGDRRRGRRGHDGSLRAGGVEGLLADLGEEHGGPAGQALALHDVVDGVLTGVDGELDPLCPVAVVGHHEADDRAAGGHFGAGHDEEGGGGGGSGRGKHGLFWAFCRPFGGASQ
jgi:hypothetical protein